jgi:hypothetical protein
VASWRTDQGVPKIGVVKSIDAPQDAWFSFNLSGQKRINLDI